MTSSRRFHNPLPVSKAEAQAILDGGNGPTIAECLVALAFGTGSDLVWDVIRTCIDSEDAGVRGVAVLCIGHMARIHGWIPSHWAAAKVHAARKDPHEFVRGHAESALDDIEIFIPSASKAR